MSSSVESSRSLEEVVRRLQEKERPASEYHKFNFISKRKNRDRGSFETSAKPRLCSGQLDANVSRNRPMSDMATYLFSYRTRNFHSVLAKGKGCSYYNHSMGREHLISGNNGDK